MTLLRIPLAVLTAALLTTPLLVPPALAHDFKVGAIEIDHPWSRATAESSPTGLVFLELDNEGETADRLISTSSPVAEKAQLHTHIVENGMMEMREVKSIDLAPGTTVKLAPDGLHVMLISLKAPLKKGQSFPLTLTFEKAGSVTVQVSVQGPGDTEPSHEGMDGMGDMPGMGGMPGMDRHDH